MLKTCSVCKRIFEDISDTHSACPDCRAKDEVLLREVKDYLWDNPGTTEAKLNELFDIPNGRIMRWLRDGRLELTPDSTIKLRCMRCASMISSGKFCADCAKKIADGFKKTIVPKDFTSVLLENPNSSDDKMRFM